MQYYFWLHCYVTVNIIRYSGYHRVEPPLQLLYFGKNLILVLPSFLPSFLCYVYCCCMDYCFSPKYFIYFCCCLHLKIACRQHVSSIVPPSFLPSFLIIRRYAVLFLITLLCDSKYYTVQWVSVVVWIIASVLSILFTFVAVFISKSLAANTSPPFSFFPSFLPATLFLLIRRRLDIFDYIAMWQYCKYYTVGIIELNPYKSSTLWSP